MIKIVNFKDYKSTEKLDQVFGPGNWHYIGRANIHYDLPESPLANKFRMTFPQDYADRLHAILLYKKWFAIQVRGNTSVIAALNAIKPDDVLVCWCAPLHCHGSVIKQYLETES